jgi:hypothetical protein
MGQFMAGKSHRLNFLREAAAGAACPPWRLTERERRDYEERLGLDWMGPDFTRGAQK